MTSTAITAEASVARGRLRIFESEGCPADPEVVSLVRRQLDDADLVAAVVLPDNYRKPHMEMPSSVTVASADMIWPTFTSAALNCGMALAALDIAPPSRPALRTFLERVREALPSPPGLRRVLSSSDVVDCAHRGALFASERYGLDGDECVRFEEGGALSVERWGGRARVRREIGWLAAQLARMRFGTLGPNTHFVELQQVERVFEPEAARAFGVERGQTTLLYHGGDGVLNIQLGARFGRRLAGSCALRAVMAVQKPVYQLRSARSARQLRDRKRLFFSGGCPPVPLASEEGDRLLLACAMAMNYGFAYRRATFATLHRIASRCLGATPRLIFDSPHNTIYEEEVDGRCRVVHRHNVARALPPSRLSAHPVFRGIGQPVLLPGTNRTCSYLCVAGEGAAESLYSANHGTGTIVKSLRRQQRSGLHPAGHHTFRLGYGTAAEELLVHLDDRGVDEGLAVLVAAGIVRPVARLRPFGSLT